MRQQENQNKPLLVQLRIFFSEGFYGLNNINWIYYKQK